MSKTEKITNKDKQDIRTIATAFNWTALLNYRK